MFEAIARPFGMLLMWLYELVGNYGLAVIIFAIIVKVILLPFMVKSKKSSLRLSRVQPRVAELQRRYATNKARLNEEMQKLYREENIKPLGGCIWTLIPFPILLALYEAIRYPITAMMGVDKALLAEGGAITSKLADMGFSAAANSAYIQIEQAQFISQHFEEFAGMSDKLRQIDFSFLGLNLGDTPQISFLWSADWSSPDVFAQLGLFLIPVISGVLTYISTKISSKMSTSSTPEQEKTMKTMNLMMPIVTIWIAFIMPAALGIYWIAGMVFSSVQDIILNKMMAKKLAEEQAEFMARQHARDAELEAKRKETERLRAENATVVNKNTSKNKLREQEKQEKADKAAQWERKKAIERGEVFPDEPSRVGDRRFARGRAYVEDRFEGGAAAAAAAVVSAEAADEAAAESDAAENELHDETPAEAVMLTEAASEEADAVSEEADDIPEDEADEEYEDEPEADYEEDNTEDTEKGEEP